MNFGNLKFITEKEKQRYGQKDIQNKNKSIHIGTLVVSNVSLTVAIMCVAQEPLIKSNI